MEWLSFGDVTKSLRALPQNEWRFCLASETQRRAAFGRAIARVKNFRDRELAHPKPARITNHQIYLLCRAICALPNMLCPSQWEAVLACCPSFANYRLNSTGASQTIWIFTELRNGSIFRNGWLVPFWNCRKFAAIVHYLGVTSYGARRFCRFARTPTLVAACFFFMVIHCRRLLDLRGRAEQIVGRERRERVSQLDSSGDA
jgi:hypothetical protein